MRNLILATLALITLLISGVVAVAAIFSVMPDWFGIANATVVTCSVCYSGRSFIKYIMGYGNG